MTATRRISEWTLGVRLRDDELDRMATRQCECEIIMERGQWTNVVYGVIDGIVRAVDEGERGGRLIVADFGVGDIVGAPSLLASRPSPFELWASASLVEVPEAIFRKYLTRDPLKARVETTRRKLIPYYENHLHRRLRRRVEVKAIVVFERGEVLPLTTEFTPYVISGTVSVFPTEFVDEELQGKFLERLRECGTLNSRLGGPVPVASWSADRIFGSCIFLDPGIRADFSLVADERSEVLLYR